MCNTLQSCKQEVEKFVREKASNVQNAVTSSISKKMFEIIFIKLTEQNDLSIDSKFESHFIWVLNVPTAPSELNFSLDDCIQNFLSSNNLMIVKLPTYLIIQISRVFKDSKTLELEKNINKMNISLEAKVNDIDFILNSVIIHRGKPRAGHYYVISRINQGWYELSDENCKLVSDDWYTDEDLQRDVCLFVYQRVNS